MIDKKALCDDLTKAFIAYQYRLDNPMPAANETEDLMVNKYMSDPIFNSRVRSLVAGVMTIVSKHEQMEQSND